MLRNRQNSYGLVAIVLHWIVAAMFLGQVALGLTMVRVHSMALQFTLIQWHKSFGFLILTLSLLRLAWRLSNHGPEQVASLSDLERIAAKTAHKLLYALLILTPLVGWALVSTSTLRVPSFAFNMLVIPDLPLARSEAAETFWRQAHMLFAYTTTAVALGHIIAALRHQFWVGDGVLRRMLNPGGGEQNDLQRGEIRPGDRKC
jgi:cytochrome b561